MKKVNDDLYTANLADYMEKVTKEIEALSNGEMKSYSPITNRVLAKHILGRLVVNDFINIFGKSATTNVNYTIRLLGSESIVIHVTNAKNDVDSGFIYTIIT